jgi:hypothetical protein
MLVFVVLRPMSYIVGEYIVLSFWLLTEATEFEMIGRGIGESQKLGQKSPKRKENHERGSFMISHVNDTLFQQLSAARADWKRKQRETYATHGQT